MVKEEVTFVIDKEEYNFDTFDVYNASTIDEHLIYYDWLANNATASHIACHRDVLTTYTPLQNSSVTGVGGKEANIAGKGTVELLST
jgi:hypothetical protein